MRGGRAAATVASIAAGLLFLRDARAQVDSNATPGPSAVVLALDYVAPGNCPSAKDFQARVGARTGHARFADEPAATVAVHVKVRATGSTYAGHLFMVGHLGTMSTRDVEDVLCTDVVDALALVTALAVDSSAALPPPPVAAAPTPASPEPPDAPPPPTPSAPPPPAPVVASPPPSPAPPVDPRPAIRRVWHLDLGLDGKLLGAIAPDTMPGGGLYGELDSTGRRWLDPSVRLSLFSAANRVFESPQARFTLLAARSDGCPVRVGSERLSVRPCAAVDVGDLLAKGLGAGVSKTSANPWVTVGPLVRGRWSPGGGRFFIDVDAAALFPVTRPNFVFAQPTTQFYRVPVVLPTASLGAGVRFP
jgi:hypothetical protein